MSSVHGFASQSSNSTEKSEIQHMATDGYWDRFLQDLEPCILSLPSHASRKSSPEWKPITIPSGFSKELPDFCSENDIEPTAITLLAWSLVLQKFLGVESVSFGYQLQQAMTTSRIAWGDTLVSRYQHQKENTIEAALTIAHSKFKESLSHQNCAENHVSRHLHLFNTLVRLASRSSVVTSPTEIPPNMFPPNVNELGMDIVLDMIDPSLPELTVWYRPAKIAEDQILTIMHTFSRIFTILMQDTQLKIGNIDCLCASDREQIWNWNKCQTQPFDVCVHEILERQAKITPHDIAIESWDGQFSYIEFDNLSTRLAHHLVDQCGVQVESMVAFAFEKSRWAAVAMTGTCC